MIAVTDVKIIHCGHKCMGSKHTMWVEEIDSQEGFSAIRRRECQPPLCKTLASFPGFPLRTSGARIKRGKAWEASSRNWEPIVT